jgi:hypothetical protein
LRNDSSWIKPVPTGGGKLNVIDIDLGLEDSVAAVIRADENGATVAALEVKLGLNDRH